MKTTNLHMQVLTPLLIAVSVVALLAAGHVPAADNLKAEMDAMKSELDALKKEQQAMKKELAELKRSGQGRRQARAQTKSFQPLDLSTEGAPYLGNQDAPVTLIEFTDYQCPYCRKHVANTLPSIIKDYVETGKLRYLVRELPVESRHPLAGKASEAALCAGDQGNYWAMHDKLFEKEARLSPDELRLHAQALGLNAAQFDQCLESGDKRVRVQEDVKAGLRAKVRGTPTFFLGLTPSEEERQFQATEVIRGAKTYPEFAVIFDKLLANAKKETAAEATVSSGGHGVDSSR